MTTERAQRLRKQAAIIGMQVAMAVLGACSTRMSDAAGPVARVPVDLASGALLKTVPFDLPLLFRGLAPANTITLKLKTTVIPDSEGEHEGTSGRALHWTMQDTWAPIGAGTGPDSFSLRIPDGIAPNQTIRMKFSFERRLTAAERTAFEGKAEARIGPVLLTPASSGDLTRVERIALCGGIRDDLLEVSGASDVNVGGECLAQLEAASSARSNWRARARAYELNAATLESALRRVNNPALIRVVTALETTSSRRDRNATLFLEGYGDSFELLVALREGQHAIISRGGTRAQPMPDLTSPKPTAIDSVAQRLVAAAYAARGIRALIRDLISGYPNANSLIDDLLAEHLIDAADTAALSSAAFMQILAELDEPFDQIISTTRQAGRDARQFTSDVQTFVDRIKLTMGGSAIVDGTSIGNFDTRAQTYVALDGGVLWSFRSGLTLAYTGAAFYFVPVNKDAQLPPAPWRDPLKRLSLVAGLTLTSVQSDSPPRTNLFAGGAGVLGLGYRMTDNVRASAGSLWFNARSGPPVQGGDDQLVVDGYAALSLDIDIIKYLQGIGGLFKSLL